VVFDDFPFNNAIAHYRKYYVRLEFLTDDSFYSHGTGFIFHKTKDELLVLTCLHNLLNKNEGDELAITGTIPYSEFKVYIEGLESPIYSVQTVFHP